MTERLIEKNGFRHAVGVDEDKLREALQRIHRRACGDTYVVYMSIPADPSRDADLLIAGAIDELVELRARIVSLEPQERILYDKFATAQTEIANLKAVLEEAVEWMGYNPPATGWGTLDHGADAEKSAIIAKARALLEAKP